MFTSLRNGASVVAAMLALAAIVGFAGAGTAYAAKTKADILIESLSKPSEAYFVKVDRDTTTNAKPATPVRSAQVKRAGGTVCCSIPRKGKLALVTPSDCRAVKGKIVDRKKCARLQRVSARKFANIVLKRGAMSSSKPATPRSLSPGAAKGVTCSNGNYYPCWCSGEEICNLFISACVEDGGEVGCTGHNEQTGEPNACACVK